MERKSLRPKNFTPEMGAYSHGLEMNLGDHSIIFVTGQIAMDNEGKVVASGDAEKQTEFIFENIEQILKEAGSSLDDVVKAQIFVTNMEDFSKISLIRNKYFDKAKPVSTLIEVNRLVKDGCAVEIEVVAIKKN